MTVEEYRRAQAGITGRLLRQLLPLLQLAPPRPSQRQWRALVAAAYPAVYRARLESYALAARFYAGERARQTGAVEVVDIPRRNYPPEALDTAWRRTVKPRLDSLDEGDPVPPVMVAEAATVAERHAADAGRQAVIDTARHDPQALGYARTPTGDSTCAFCLMLTSRGPVYKSASAALLRDGTSEPYHDRCDCIAVPVFDRGDWAGRDEYVNAKRVWDDHGGTLADFRRFLDGQRPDTVAEQPAA